MVEPSQEPLARALAAPPHLSDPSGSLGVWWTEPPGAVLSLLEPARGTTEKAEWVVGPALEELLARFSGVRDLAVVLDMRRMIGRSATARATLLQASQAAKGRIRRVVLLPSRHMGSAYMAIIEATAVLLRAAGYQVHVEDDLEAALAKHGLRIESLSGVQRLLSGERRRSPAR